MIDPRDLDEMEKQWNVDLTSYYWELRLLAEVRRLQEALNEAEFKQWYYMARLDAWASKAMTFEHILQDQGDLLSGYAKFKMENAEKKFRTECDEITERLKAHTVKVNGQ